MFAPPEFPCSMGKNSKIRLFRPSTDQNTMLQVADSIRVRRKFRYAAEQRNFGGLSGELNGRTEELQRNCLSAGFVSLSAAVTLFDRGTRVVCCFALRPGPAKGDERAVAVGKFDGLRAIEVPPGVVPG